MHIVILGCGRVGSLLAHRLDDMGHSVAVVDQDPSSFRKLATGLQRPDGHRRSASTARPSRRRDRSAPHAFAAVSSGDNSNILAARVARETFGVEQVVARIYDPRRAEVYQRLGIPTVATVSWSADQILRRILPLGAPGRVRATPAARSSLAEVHRRPTWLGRTAFALEPQSGARIAFITRYGEALLPDADTVMQDGDLVHALFAPEAREHVERIFEHGPEEA